MSVISSSLLDTPTVGLEDLQRAAFYVFYEGMNNAINQIAEYWNPRDVQFDEVTGRTTAPTSIEPIPPGNFHEGHKPSLISANPDSYPNLAVFALRADPSNESGSFDQMDSFSDLLMVEILVKGEDEDTTNRRIQRTGEAVVLCLRRNPQFGGAVTGLESAPQLMISDLFALRSPSQSGGYGDRYVWQGAQITFRIRKDSVSPSSGPGTFSQASQTDYSKFIDQG
jgi:hypothetical protein